MKFDKNVFQKWYHIAAFLPSILIVNGLHFYKNNCFCNKIYMKYYDLLLTFVDL